MTSTAVYIFAPYRLLPAQRRLLCVDAAVKLGGRAFDVLVALVERRDRTVSKNELMDLVWPKVVVEENNLEVQIVSLRKVFGHPAIATVPGRGYQFTLPVTVEGDEPFERSTISTSALQESRRTNLPTQAPQLIGREEELEALRALLRQSPIVTVTGSPGIGKSRLAQAVAVGEINETQGGVWWADLAPIADTAHVASTVAVVLGLSLQGASDPLDVIVNAVRDQAMLIVLDNAEHVVLGVVGLCAALRREAPNVRLLITSQEPLKVNGESVFRAEALSLPSSDDPVQISESAAVKLFVCRAKAVERRFELRPDNQVAIAEICRGLDGIPLAIELAAARVSLLGVDGLREKLDQRLYVLTTGRRELPKRHQTLRAALDWSHQLLSAQEQSVFRRLGVFVGGFTLEAAQEIASDDAKIDQWDVLEHLGALVEKSLVVAEGDSLPRYRMLETTRLFALERLIESAEAENVRRRHRDYFLHLAEESDKMIRSNEARTVLTRLDQERDNLLTAMKWSINEEDPQLALRLARAMGYYWFARAMTSTGAELTALALSRPGSATPGAIRCRALVTAGWLSMWEVGKEHEATKHMEDALAMARTLNDSQTLCHVLTKFAEVQHNLRESQSSLCLSAQALEIGRKLGDTIELADALVLRARVAWRAGDLHLARQLFSERMRLRGRIKNDAGSVSAMLCLSELKLQEGNQEAARSHLEEAADIASVIDSNVMAIYVIRSTAEYAAATGQAEAAVLFQSAFARQFKRAGMRHWLSPEQSEASAYATLNVPESRRQALAEEARSITLEQAFQRARIFMANEN